MPSVSESAGNQSQLTAALAAGVDSLSVRQQVGFQLYNKIVVAQDGYVFWVPAGQSLTIVGSLHYSTDRAQDEDQTIAVNQVLLTSEQEITEFNLVSPTQMWIGGWPIAQGDAALRVAFSRRGDYFGPANLWHYSGFAVYPALQSQIVATASDIPAGPIVSNSLPIWLSQNSLAPVYPSFLVPDNAVPPYVVAHIEPDGTEALGAFPDLPWPTPINLTNALVDLTSQQLCRDRVRLTLYGFTNQRALQYLVGLIAYSQDTDAFGFMNSPAIRDDKRTQAEIAAIAMRKTINIVASYYQSAANVIARRLILQALVTTTPATP